jgi:hypothetical protein
MSLLTDLDAFSLEHRRCGDLDGGVDGPIVWAPQSHVIHMARRVAGPGDAYCGSPYFAARAR